MECVGAMAEGEWSSFNGMYSTEEADFMAQLLGNCSLPNEVLNSSNFELSSAFLPSHECEGPVYSSDDTSANMYSFLQGSSHSGGRNSFFPISSTHQYYPGEYPNPILMRNDSSVSINYYIADGKNTSSSDQMYANITLIEAGDEYLNQDVSNDSMESAGDLPEDVSEGKILQLGTEHEMPVPETSLEDKEDSLSETSKKRPRIPIDVKNKRIIKPRKNQKLKSTDNNDENDKHPVLHREHSSNCLSEDDSNASQELNGGADSMANSKGATTALNINGKTRASRGSATDPQSLYARKRRERINERLRILQNLVPNGTKVDISTMLEEAVQYVKFLQLQIKLLSSDDLWMYAPIAYNGMNIGLDLKIGTPKS